MPSQDSPGSAGPPKRPSLVSRNSSGPALQFRSNSDNLSTSAQRHKGSSRHVVGRMGPRVPSYNKNLSKLTRLMSANSPTAATSPQQQISHHKRNYSTQALAKDAQTTILRKNHSETSLKKNRSNGQLVKLARPHSSRNVRIHGRREAKRNSQVIAPEGLDNPTVRFDLGGEADDQDSSWVEESAPVSPSTTKSNTAANALSHTTQTNEAHSRNDDSRTTSTDIGEWASTEQNPKPSRAQSIKFETINPTKQGRDDSDAKGPRISPDHDRITDKLLHRNVSFNTTAQVSSVSATGHDASTFHRTGNQSHEHGDRELVSRFINGGSSGGTPRESSFLPHHERGEHEPSASDGPVRSKSVKNMTQASPQSKVQHGGSGSAIALPSSRTQQKLWLERASSSIEPQQGRPISLMRPGRPGSLALQALSGDGRANAQLKHLFDQTDVEYCRVRLFQHPLNDAIGRIKANVPLTSSGPSSRTYPSRSAAGQELAENRAPPVAASESRADSSKAVEPRRGKVMFQGIKEDDGNVDEQHESLYETGQREEARSICRRLWERHISSHEE